MAVELLDYDDTFWSALLPDISSTSRTNTQQKIHLVVSLVLYLSLPLKDLLGFLFSSSNR